MTRVLWGILLILDALNIEYISMMGVYSLALLSVLQG